LRFKRLGVALISVRSRLLTDRKALLDLGTRNRLINIPLRTKNIRAIEIVDGKAPEVFSLLTEGKRFAFLPSEAELAEEESALVERGSSRSIAPQQSERVGKDAVTIERFAPLVLLPVRLDRSAACAAIVRGASSSKYLDFALQLGRPQGAGFLPLAFRVSAPNPLRLLDSGNPSERTINPRLALKSLGSSSSAR
jgi:hypothetical protein